MTEVYNQEIAVTLGNHLLRLLKELDTFHLPFNGGTSSQEHGFTLIWEGEIIEVVARRKEKS